jgi:hypothetical protein
VGALVAVLASLVVTTGVSSPVAADEARPAPSLAVWPRTGLVDDQPLRVLLRNWPNRNWLVVFLCRAGDDGFEYERNRCDLLGELDPGPRGGDRLRTPADVIVDGKEPLDCRIVACEVQVLDLNAEEDPRRLILRVPLTFDPAGPDPTRPPTTATPTTGLEAGDEVTVTGSGYPMRLDRPAELSADPAATRSPEGDDGPPRPVHLFQCRTGATTSNDCDQHQQVVGMTPAGRFTGAVEVRSRLYLGDGGSIDCRTEDCVVLASSNWQFSEAGSVPIELDPGGPAPAAPTVTVTPAAGVQDGEDLTITGTHFPANSYPTLVLCPPGAEGWDFFSCHDVFDFRATNAQGRITYHHPAHTRVNPKIGRDVDCVAVECSWVITWGDVDDAPRAPQVFAPEVVAKRWRLTATPTSGLRDGERIRVTGRGYDAVEVTGLRQCVVGRRSIATFRCGGPRGRVEVDPSAPSSFRTTYAPTRVFFANTTLVNCARRVCYLATDDDENGLVRGPNLTFRP